MDVVCGAFLTARYDIDPWGFRVRRIEAESAVSTKQESYNLKRKQNGFRMSELSRNVLFFSLIST